MFRDLFKNKAALFVVGGALLLIGALALVFVFFGGGTALVGGGRSGGSAAAFAPGEVEPAPEPTPEPTAKQTPEPQPTPTPKPTAPSATPEPAQGDLYVSETMRFSIQLSEGMSVNETAKYSLQFMLGGVNVGGVIYSDATTRELMEQARDEFIEWTVESAGADGYGDVIQEDAQLNIYPAVILSVELLVDGEPAYQLFNFFVDAPAGGCFVISYMSLLPMDDAELELVSSVLRSFTMLDYEGAPPEPPGEAPPLEGYDTYTNEALGFSVQYPDGYIIETGLEENAVDFYWERNADVGVDIKVYEDASAGDIHAATLSFERYSEFGIEFISEETIARGRYEYISLRYEFAIEDDFVYERNIVIIGGNAFVISWIAPDYAAIEMPADAEVFLESFRVLDR